MCIEYLGYVKKMILRKLNLIKLERKLHKLKLNYRPATTLANEYTEYPEYPPIEDLSLDSRLKKRKQQWCESVKNCKTVEEKLMKLNMPRYYGWKCINFNDTKIPYNAQPLIQHCTRTCFIDNLPTLYNNISVDKVEEIQSSIEDAILFEHDILKSYDINKTDLTPAERENRLTKSIVKQINRIILNNLSDPHLIDTQVDLDPRHEAFWFVGGINPPEKIRKMRENVEWLKHQAELPVDRQAQYLGTPPLALRSKLPLEPIIPYDEITDSNKYDIPVFNYEPNTIGFTTHHRHGTNVPGFWPGDKYEFGLLSYQSRGHILERPSSFGEEDNQEALNCQGILSSFAWGLAQASYQGFTTFNDLTYPLVMQTIITNGQDFSFYTYQLNTTTFYADIFEENQKRNICWGTRTQKLYQEINDGKIVGFNPDVLKNLLKFYKNVPKERNEDMKPYLDKSETIVAQIKDQEKREWLEAQYKHMVSNRPRHLPMYEVYHWEKIYKIDHNTRPLEAKRRPFELGINPWKRRYDERSPSYIPKALRPGGPKSKDKFYKSYYP